MRRQLADSNVECEKYIKSNKELRDHVKRAEIAKRELARGLEESCQKVNNLEENRNALEKERVRLSQALKDAENNLNKAHQELQMTRTQLQKMQQECEQKREGSKDLQHKLNAEMELKDKAQQELNQVKKQVSRIESIEAMGIPNSGELPS